MKKTHFTIRFSDETDAIIKKYQEQFGTERSETIERLIQAADGKQFVTVVTSSVSRVEELSYFSSQLDKTKTLWREIKSRLNAPRPIDPRDVEAINQWRADREKIKKFYSECDALWKLFHSLTATLAGATLDDIHKMQQVLELLSSWAAEYKKAMNQKTNLQEKESIAKAVRDIECVISLLNRLGVKTN